MQRANVRTTGEIRTVQHIFINDRQFNDTMDQKGLTAFKARILARLVEQMIGTFAS